MASGGNKETGSNLLNIGTLALGTDDLDPSGVVVVGGKLVITDWNSYKVHVFSRHDGTLLSSSDGLESIPCGLCRVNDTDLCVVMDDGIITLMSVQDSGLISRGKTFHLKPSFDECHGVGVFKDNVVVSGVKDNTICWCVVSLKDGRHDDLHKVCGGGWSYLTTKSNMVFISCIADSYDDSGVYGLNLLNPRQQPYTYKCKELPWGITVDDKGDLFVCFNDYYSIHHLTSTCQLVDIYREGIPRGLYNIFWDSGILYVISFRSNVIYSNIYRYRTPHQGPAKTWMYQKDEKRKGLVEDVAKLTIDDTKGKPQKVGSTLFGTTLATKATGSSFGGGGGFGTSGKLHRNVLNRCLSALLEDLDFKAVSVYIQEKELFDPVTMRDILEQKTTSEKIKELIERIQLRDQNTYDKFKQCLVQAKQEFLKDMLEKEEAKLLQSKGKI